MDRREFLKTAVVTAAAAAPGFSINARGANDRVVVGIMGVRVRGAHLAGFFLQHPDVEVRYIADPDTTLFDKTIRAVQAQHPRFDPSPVPDFRRILDDAEVDALVVAAPDHWHALATILACQAGKDVYVEKPVSHNVHEGRRMVAAARKYGRVVQAGTQNRSMPCAHAAREYVRGSEFGAIHFVRAVNQKMRPPLPRDRAGAVPDGVDYDLWLGPAPARPFSTGHFHGTWHWWWDYSGGDIANDGVHQLDLVRFMLGQELPHAVSANGGSFYFSDYNETPDTMTVSYAFPGLNVVYEQSLYTRYMLKDPHTAPAFGELPPWSVNGQRIEVYGSRQQLCFARHGGGWEAFGAMGESLHREPSGRTDYVHIENFIDCVRTRKTPNADIAEGHRSTLLCHYANMSLRTGGRTIQIDPRTEMPVNEPEAAALATRTYREPWVLPDTV